MTLKTTQVRQLAISEKTGIPFHSACIYLGDIENRAGKTAGHIREDRYSIPLYQIDQHSAPTAKVSSLPAISQSISLQLITRTIDQSVSLQPIHQQSLSLLLNLTAMVQPKRPLTHSKISPPVVKQSVSLSTNLHQLIKSLAICPSVSPKSFSQPTSL